MSANSASSQQKQALLDTAKRARSGTWVYLLLWLVMGLAYGLHHSHPSLLLGNAAFIALLGLARMALLKPILIAPLEQIPRLQRCFEALVIISPAHWSVLTSLTLFHPDLQALQVPMLLASTGITAAGTMVMAINSRIRLFFPSLMLLPNALLLAFSGDHTNMVVASLCLIFIVYMQAASRNINADYWEAVNNRALLAERAAELEELSTTDPLTQLRNRLFFDRHFSIEWKRAQRHQKPVSILLMDIDHFKHLNDSHGHAFGDACLQAVARALKEELQRSGDIVARYGGEEFIVLLSDTTEADAVQVSARLLEKLRGLQLRHDNRPVGLTVSIGVASCVPLAHEEGHRLIHRADQALYAAKDAGRDCYRVYAPPQPTA